jgi:acyl-CoA thioester hydrolase
MSGAADWPFTYSDEIRFSDLDVMGHLNNVAFLVFVESARVAYLRSLVPEHDPTSSSDFGVLVAEAKVSYRAPGRFGERVDTHLRPDDLGRTSFRSVFEMRVGERVLADGYAVMVVCDRATWRPVPIPEGLRELLEADGARPRGPLTNL